MGLNVDGEGYLVDRTEWNEAVGAQLAETDGYELDEDKLKFIQEARRMYDENGTVPALRKFSKEMGMDVKELYAHFPTGPMKMICKWGGLPKPTGCV
ncbi:TusE/DsrC/DsvC family sulfur relay protein [Magnetospira thiophila]